MNHLELSRRLKTVSQFVPEGSRLADIGSDHAYLPVALALRNQISYAVAGEVVEGPYFSAQNQVSRHGLTDRIKVRLANGLTAIEESDQISVITICGMGGSLIREILEQGKKDQRLKLKEKLILQPNVGEKLVREWLQANAYQITAEAILEENQKIYEVIVAEPSEHAIEYTLEQLYFGPFLLKEKNVVFRRKWQQELKQKLQVIRQLERSQSDQQEKLIFLQNEISMIEEVLTIHD